MIPTTERWFPVRLNQRNDPRSVQLSVAMVASAVVLHLQFAGLEGALTAGQV
jgi:hypothetical protein